MIKLLSWHMIGVPLLHHHHAESYRSFFDLTISHHQPQNTGIIVTLGTCLPKSERKSISIIPMLLVVWLYLYFGHLPQLMPNASYLAYWSLQKQKFFEIVNKNRWSILFLIDVFSLWPAVLFCFVTLRCVLPMEETSRAMPKESGKYYPLAQGFFLH